MALNKYNCNLSPSLFYFDRKGIIRIVKRIPSSPDESTGEIDFDEIFEHALEAGAEDIKLQEDYLEDDDVDFGKPVYEIIVEPADTAKIAQNLKVQFGYEIKEMGIEYVGKEDSEVELDQDHGEVMQKLVNMLDDIDDVQDVYTNAK